MRRLDHLWRLLGTGLGFSVFGVGGIVISVVFFSLIHLISSTREQAQHRCQYVVHQTFRLFVWLIVTLGVVSFEAHGAEKLKTAKGWIIIANHPSLLDVVFIVSLLPQAKCVVKKAVWSNPFFWGVVLATGYIQSGTPEELIDECRTSLESGDNVIIFPEGTRSVPGQELKLRRGAAAVISNNDRPFLPIFITCTPAAFLKGQKWYRIPSRRAHFVLTVGDIQDWRNVAAREGSPSKVNRQLTRSIKALFEEGIMQHERYG